MSKRAVAALGVALVVGLSELPAAAACVAAAVKDENPDGGVRTGLTQPAPGVVWISGTIVDQDSTTRPYVEHFDPITGWARSVLGLHQSGFNAIAAFPSGQAIAVGFEDSGASALAIMFDGSRWLDMLGSSTEKRYRGSLERVAVVPGTPAAYAVLAYGPVNLLHWDGSTWTTVTDALPLGSVLAVGAASANDVWAVGGRTDRYGVVHGMAERFHDGRWTQLKPPAKLTLLTGVDVRTPNEVWVTGLSQQGSMFVPFAAHWDGSVWRQLSLPLPNSPSSELGGLYAQSATNVWISASQWQHGGSVSALWHWNGNVWHYVTGSNAWTDTPLLAGFPGDVWFAAGQYRRTRFDGNRWVGTAACQRPEG